MEKLFKVTVMLLKMQHPKKLRPPKKKIMH